MPKTEYTIDGDGLRMEFDAFYSLDNVGNFSELSVIRCTGIFLCPRKRFYRVPFVYLPAAAQTDAEREAERQHIDDIIKQIEGELLAAKHSDAERREEGDR